MQTVLSVLASAWSMPGVVFGWGLFILGLYVSFRAIFTYIWSDGTTNDWRSPATALALIIGGLLLVQFAGTIFHTSGWS